MKLFCQPFVVYFFEKKLTFENFREISEMEINDIHAACDETTNNWMESGGEVNIRPEVNISHPTLPRKWFINKFMVNQ